MGSGEVESKQVLGLRSTGLLRDFEHTPSAFRAFLWSLVAFGPRNLGVSVYWDDCLMLLNEISVLRIGAYVSSGAGDGTLRGGGDTENKQDNARMMMII